MNNLITLFTTLILLTSNINSTVLEAHADELPECVVTTHCVRVNWEVSNAQESFKKTLKAISNTPRTKVIEQTDSYIHAEAKTKWMRYTDDLLVKALPEKGIIQLRSESRVGIGDNGVNKKRIEDLAYRVMTNQIN